MRLALWLALLWPGSAAAADLDLRANTSGAFLRLGVGARAVAMGEAFSAVCDDASAPYWNPAGMLQLEKRTATLSHALFLDSISYDYAAYVQNLGKYGGVGGSIQFLSAGRITETDAAGAVQGSFIPNDLSLGLSYAYEFRETPMDPDSGEKDPLRWTDGWSIGVTGKYVRSQIRRRDETGTMDVGLLSPLYWEGRLSLALVAQSIGGVIKLDKENQVLPFVFKTGAALRLAERWVLAADLAVPREGGPYAALGAERRWPWGDGWAWAARAGLNTRSLEDLDGLRGVSGGGGVTYQDLDVDYAVSALGSLGWLHQFTVSVRF